MHAWPEEHFGPAKAAGAPLAGGQVGKDVWTLRFINRFPGVSTAGAGTRARCARIWRLEGTRLYDALIRENPSVAEKRALLDIMAIQQSVTADNVRWVPTALMVADPLTKDDAGLRQRMVSWLAKPVCRLHA